jgi:hypothetical protein
MAIDFPASPTTNQTYTFGTKTWTYNGTAWALSTTSNVAFTNVSQTFTASQTFSSQIISTATTTASSTTGAISYGTLGYSDVNHLGIFQSSVNSYNQLVLQNTNSGSSASTDFVVTNNLGTASTFYGNLGMNSSTFTGSGSLNLANAVYLTSTSGDLVLGTTTANSIRFVTNSGTTDAISVSSAGAITVLSSITGATGFTTSAADFIFATPSGATSNAITITSGTSTSSNTGAVTITTGITTSSAAGASTTGALTLSTGNGSSSQANSGSITIKSGNGAGTSANSGGIIIDAGAPSGGGTTGTLSIGATNATTITLGKSGATVTVNANTTHVGATTFGNTYATVFQGNISLGAPSAVTPQAGQQMVATGTSVGSSLQWGTPNFLRWKTGSYYAPSSTGFGTFTGALTQIYMVPMYIPNSQTLVKIGINVASAGTTGALIRLGIYSNTDTGTSDIPNSLILDAGTVASDTTGYKEITISKSLQPGTYWLAYQMTVAACGITSITSMNKDIAVLTANPTTFYGGYSVTTTSGAAFLSGPVTINLPISSPPRIFLGT